MIKNNNIKIFIILSLSIFACLAIADICVSEEEYAYYFKSRGIVKDTGQFMKLRGKLGERIRDKERKENNFAIAGYYFRNNIFRDAQAGFSNYVSENPPGVDTLLANVFLFKLAKINYNEEKAEAIKKDIFNNQFILLFNEFQTLNYTSKFRNEYEIRYYVDKIEIYLNGKIFEQIEP